MEKKQYGLFTAVAMIVGIVIGSGIFFKSDNILVYTNGSIPLGVLVFTIAAISIIFGSLSISELAKRTSDPGGLISYANEFSGKGTACGFGWFQVLIYYPSITVVLSWVVGIYVCMLFGWEATHSLLLTIGSISLVSLFTLNILSAKLGGYFQNASTIIKLIPLFSIAVAGFIFGDPKIIIPSHEAATAGGSVGWIAAIAPIAFSYDGWVVSTSIAHEIKNSERNLPLAMIFAPIFILIAYLLYFIGISILVGPEQIMALGDSHVNVAAQQLIGTYGAKIVLIFIVISVLGTVNGFVLGFIRLPYSLAIKGYLPFADKIGKKHEGLDSPVNSAIFAFIITIVWGIVNYYVMLNGINLDVSEISIVTSYVLYIALYISVIKLFRKKEIKSVSKGLVIPSIAICGSLIILFGGIQNPINIFYIIFCLAVIGISQIYIRLKSN